MEILISRMPHVNDRQTCGYFFVLNKKKEVVYKCYCIELPDLNNAPQISRIPEGKYMVVKRNSPKFNDHFHILNVPGREYILIHQGNFYTQIRGCILVGQDLEDINKDGILDVTQSVFTMRKLNQILPKEFSLTIQKLNAVTL